MRGGTAFLVTALLVGTAASADAQWYPVGRPQFRIGQQRFRIAVNGGQQVTSTSFSEGQTFDQYFEQGSFKFERTIPRRAYYDVGVAVRVWRRLSAGLAVSFLDAKGPGQVTAQVPHPFYFNQARTVTGEVQNGRRREGAGHIQASWTVPLSRLSRRLELTVSGGPTIFIAEQVLMRTLEVGLDKEVFPFDALAFPGATTETLRENAIGFNAGGDVSWTFSRNVAVGVLVRYSRATKDFTPTGGKPVTIETGGLHAGGGLRVRF